MSQTDYEALNKSYRKNKSALTRAKNSNDPLRVLFAVELALDDFDKHGWPDQWATWSIALGDAHWAFLRNLDSNPGNEREFNYDRRFNEALRRFA